MFLRKTLLLINLDDSYHSESEFYYPDELGNVENVVGHVNMDDQPELRQLYKKINTLFTV